MSEVTPENKIGYYIMVIGLFMAILDIQIVASSIGEIQAHLSASLDEISWVQTSYLIAEVIMIPITGWLIRVFSTRLLFSISAGLFTLASVLCACAWNIESMIVFRAIQGFFGGALIPTVFSAIYIIFPKSEQSKATITAGLVATVAPTLGPILGGWLTSNFSWHWLFLMNVIPGFFVTFAVLKFVHIDKPNFKMLKRIDILGFIYIAITLGSLEVVLKNGSKNDWFESFSITALSLTAAFGFLLLLIQELRSKEPIIELRAFLDRNFTIGCILSFSIGVGLFGSLYLLPLLLTTVKHYNSLQIGEIMLISGVAQFFSAPLAGFLEKKLELRMMLGIGIACFATGALLNGFMTLELGFDQLLWPQAARGLSIMLCFLPMTAITLGTLPKDQIQNASGLYNLMRNLGGAIGIALLDWYLRYRIRSHQVALSDSINQDRLNHLPDNPLTGFLANYSTDLNLQKTLELKMLSHKVLEQALVKAFNDAFLMVGIYLLAALLLIPLVSKVKPTENKTAH